MRKRDHSRASSGHVQKACDEWLTTRNKSKIQPRVVPHKKHSSALRHRQNCTASTLKLTQSPPPTELKTCTKQSSILSFFQSSGRTNATDDKGTCEPGPHSSTERDELSVSDCEDVSSLACTGDQGLPLLITGEQNLHRSVVYTDVIVHPEPGREDDIDIPNPKKRRLHMKRVSSKIYFCQETMGFIASNLGSKGSKCYTGIDGPDNESQSADMDSNGPNNVLDSNGPNNDMDSNASNNESQSAHIDSNGPENDMDSNGSNIDSQSADIDSNGPENDMDSNGPNNDMDSNGPNNESQNADIDSKGPNNDMDSNGPNNNSHCADIDSNGSNDSQNADIDSNGPNNDSKSADIDSNGPNNDSQSADIDNNGPNNDSQSADIDSNGSNNDSPSADIYSDNFDQPMSSESNYGQQEKERLQKNVNRDRAVSHFLDTLNNFCDDTPGYFAHFLEGSYSSSKIIANSVDNTNQLELIGSVDSNIHITQENNHSVMEGKCSGSKKHNSLQSNSLSLNWSQSDQVQKRNLIKESENSSDSISDILPRFTSQPDGHDGPRIYTGDEFMFKSRDSLDKHDSIHLDSEFTLRFQREKYDRRERLSRLIALQPSGSISSIGFSFENDSQY